MWYRTPCLALLNWLFLKRSRKKNRIGPLTDFWQHNFFIPTLEEKNYNPDLMNNSYTEKNKLSITNSMWMFEQHVSLIYLLSVRSIPRTNRSTECCCIQPSLQRGPCIFNVSFMRWNQNSAHWHDLFQIVYTSTVTATDTFTG